MLASLVRPAGTPQSGTHVPASEAWFSDKTGSLRTAARVFGQRGLFGQSLGPRPSLGGPAPTGTPARARSTLPGTAGGRPGLEIIRPRVKVARADSSVVALRPVSAPKTVDEYLARVPPRYRTALQRLRRTLRSVAPEAEEGISYGMPTFRHHGTRLYFAAFKDHCSLFGPSAWVRRELSHELEPFETGKGTLRFTPERPLPAELVRRVVRACLEEDARRGTTRQQWAGRPRSSRLGPSIER